MRRPWLWSVFSSVIRDEKKQQYVIFFNILNADNAVQTSTKTLVITKKRHLEHMIVDIGERSLQQNSLTEGFSVGFGICNKTQEELSK